MKMYVSGLTWILLGILACFIIPNWVQNREINIAGFFLLGIASTFFFIETLNLLLKKNLLSKSIFLNLATFIFTIAGLAVSSEILMRIFVDSLRAHNEQNGDINYHSAFQIYLNQCDSCGGCRYVNQSNAVVEIRNKEFSYKHKYNGYGLRDKQFIHTKSSNEFRILGIGDSFTEGVGTSADSTWLKQLEKKLNHTSKGIFFTTLNAGVHGSDLVFAYDLLENCLLSFKPDLVILDLNSTDIGDVSRAGGNERFDSLGNFKPKQGPWWEFTFGCSYIVRWFTLKTFHYDWQFDSPVEQQKREERSLEVIAQKITEFQLLANKNNFNFLLVLQPLHYDLIRKDFLAPLQLDSSIKRINMYPYFKEKIINQNTPLEKYYWPIDGHFKSFGYGEMANQIFDNYFSVDSTIGILEKQFQ